MALGALIDLGVPPDALESELRKIGLENWSLETFRERRGSIEGVRVVFSAGEQPHRTFSDIEALLRASGLERRVTEKSLAIFERIAAAEGRVHGMAPRDVHFHEVGAVDSILDIAGTVFCLEYLKIEKVYCSAVPLGSGWVDTAHGKLPVPAPATSLLLAGVPVTGFPAGREMTTPTGAAIVSSLAQSFGPPPSMTLLGAGFGAGTFPGDNPPNLLRILYGKSRVPPLARDLLVIETSIDDMNPEIYNYVLDKLFALGALDVNLIPMQMKKNRPGTLLRALIEPALEGAATELILTETTSLGIRVQEVRRIEVPREEGVIRTEFGPCRVKRIALPNGRERVIPEYEECRRIAEKTGIPLPDVYKRVVEEEK